jgi:hypothetical protein
MTMYNSIPIFSRIGQLSVTATDARHVHVASDGVTLRRVVYRVSAHLWKQASGAWDFFNPEEPKTASTYGMRRNVYISRADTLLGDTSEPARRDITSAVLDALNGFMREQCGRDLLTAADRDDAERALETAREEFANAEKGLSAALGQLVTARRRLESLAPEHARIPSSRDSAK